MDIWIRKLLIAFYNLPNNIQSKAITWQASINMGNLFKFNHFSLISHCDKLCVWALGLGIKLSYLFKTNLVFIWYWQGKLISTITNKQRKYLICICNDFKSDFNKIQCLYVVSEKCWYDFYWVNFSRGEEASIFKLFTSNWLNFVQISVKQKFSKCCSDSIYLYNH